MPSLFQHLPTPLAGLLILQRRVIADGRGSFSRLFCADELRELGWSSPVAQSNHSHTAERGSVRGMHFQLPPHGEDKLVTCIRGEILDVAVDLRRESATFLQWHAEVLSEQNQRSLLIPKGFAHGFQALVDACDLLYMHSRPYLASAEGGISPLDPRLQIQWPLQVRNLSTRDAGHPPLDKNFTGI